MGLRTIDSGITGRLQKVKPKYDVLCALPVTLVIMVMENQNLNKNLVAGQLLNLPSGRFIAARIGQLQVFNTMQPKVVTRNLP